MSKHTEGPWKYQKPRGHQHAIDRRWEIVAPCPEGGEYVIVGEHTGIDCLSEANAKIIAACPTMYKYVIKRASLGDADAKIIAESLGWRAS